MTDTPKRDARPVEIDGRAPVLIVSANREDAVAVEILLKQGGLVNITRMQDGLKALERCAAERFMLVLVHNEVEQVPGWLFLKECKLAEQIPNMAAILFGRGGSPVSSDELKKYGVKTYLESPFQKSAVLQSAMQALAEMHIDGSLENKYSKAKDSLRERRSDDAVNRYTELRQQTQGSLRSTFGLAQAYDQKGDANQVGALIGELAKTEPKLPNAALFEAKLLVQQRRFDEALSRARTCLEQASDSPLYYLSFLSLFSKAQYLDGMGFVAEAAHVKGLRHADIAMARARVSYSAGENDKALKILRELEREFGVTAELLNFRGVCLRKAEKYREAVGCYEEALRLKPMDYRVLFNLGLCYESMRDLKQALHFFETTLEAAPEYEKAAERVREIKIALTPSAGDAKR